MKPSPLIYRCVLVASLSLLNTGSAWSAPEPQEKLKTAASVDAKAIKAKVRKAKTSKTKTDKNITPEKAVDADIKKTVSATASVVTVNPYLANQPVAAAEKAVNPYMPKQNTQPPSAPPVIASPPVVAASPAAQSGNMTTGARNPYLAYQFASTPPDSAKFFNPFASSPEVPAPAKSNTGNPATTNPQQTAVIDVASSFNQIFTSLKMALPALSLPGDVTTLLPVIKKVYPTGEKPLVVLNFKCPTEMIGITPPPMKLLHEAVNLGFEGLNRTNLLSFNLQQVCS